MVLYANAELRSGGRLLDEALDFISSPFSGSCAKAREILALPGLEVVEVGESDGRSGVRVVRAARRATRTLYGTPESVRAASFSTHAGLEIDDRSAESVFG